MAHSDLGCGWTWRFASGERWRVALKGMAPPRGAWRLVVRSVDPDGAGLEALASVPGRRDLAIHVEDAHPLRRRLPRSVVAMRDPSWPVVIAEAAGASCEAARNGCSTPFTPPG